MSQKSVLGVCGTSAHWVGENARRVLKPLHLERPGPNLQVHLWPDPGPNLQVHLWPDPRVDDVDGQRRTLRSPESAEAPGQTFKSIFGPPPGQTCKSIFGPILELMRKIAKEEERQLHGHDQLPP
jgi:hypothetical protein